MVLPVIGTLATWAVLFIFLSYLLPHFLVTWFFKVGARPRCPHAGPITC